MPSKATTFRTVGPKPRQDVRASREERGYTWKWRKARLAFLNANPLCRTCEQQGRTAQGEVVDHIVPHKGNMNLFWDTANWQSLCFRCHNTKSAKE